MTSTLEADHSVLGTSSDYSRLAQFCFYLNDQTDAPRLRSLKVMKNVTLDARGFLFLPNSENGPQEQVYRLKFVYGKLASTGFNVAFPFFSKKFLTICLSNVAATPLVLRHRHTKIECDFPMVYHHVYFLNVGLNHEFLFCLFT